MGVGDVDNCLRLFTAFFGRFAELNGKLKFNAPVLIRRPICPPSAVAAD